MFNPHAFLGTMGRNDMVEFSRTDKYTDEKIITKFYKRFPQLKAAPHVYGFNWQRGSDKLLQSHPIFDFVQKYKKMRRQGYTEYKAFSTVEQELAQVLDGQLNETRILRGAALASKGDSYLDRA